MGLCKCPQKSVTNQFCFEHRVNVCEHCMVTNHTKCVVLSYLLWLRDSDYDPNCPLCKTDLSEGDCIRLVCYHVFHWNCLNKYASNLPSHSSPEQYVCPICKICIFPPSNMVSPVAETLRNSLIGVNWAQSGINHIEENMRNNNSFANDTSENLSKFSPVSQLPADDLHKPHEIDVHSTSLNFCQPPDRRSRPEPYGSQLSSGHYAASRKTYTPAEHRGSHLKSLLDPDEDKYKRRSIVESFNRWLQSRVFLGGIRRRDPHLLYKKWVVVAMLAIITLCTLVILFLHMGRASADTDPLLDPHFNPNIRVQDSMNNIIPDAVKEGHEGLNPILPR